MSRSGFDEPEKVMSEFLAQSDKERRQNLWIVEELERFQNQEDNLLHLINQAANDNDLLCYRFFSTGQASLVLSSPCFRRLLVLWRECQYDVLLTKLAFPL